MPDPTPNDGFTFHITEAEKAAKDSLPTAADLLQRPAELLVTFDWLGGIGRVTEAGKVQDTYHQLIDHLGRRQFAVAAAARHVAVALQEVIDLYRRADGQA